MKKIITALVVSVGFLAISVINTSAGDSYPYRGVCPNGGIVFPGDYYNSKDGYWVDKWRLAQCNCTSYVAWKLNELGVGFTNQYGGLEKWSHAKYWGSKAKIVGIPVDATPFPGDVAWWENKGGYGHVALVKKVTFNSGKTVGINTSEYNTDDDCKYHEEYYQVGASDYPTGFIHIFMYEVGALGYLDCLEMGDLCGEIFINVSSSERSQLIKNLQNYSYLNVSAEQKAAWDARFNSGGGGLGGGTSPSYSSTKPDFYVKSVKISDDSDGEHPKESYFPIEKFYIIGTGSNAGIKSPRDIKMGFYAFDEDGDREKLGEESIKKEHLLKGMTHTERAEVEDMDPGTYYVKVRLDNDKVVTESNEDNNWSSSVKLKIKDWPNFTVSWYFFEEGATFLPGSTAIIRSKFWNKGGDTKDGIGVACYLESDTGPILLGTETIKDYHLEEDEYHWESMVITLPSTPGKYFLRVVADPVNLVRESNESDNSLTVPLTVVSPFVPVSLPYEEHFDNNGTAGFVMEDHISSSGSQVIWVQDNGNGCLAITNNHPASSEFWHVRAKKTGFPLKPGKSYHLDLFLKASVAGRIKIQFSQNIFPYSNLGLSKEVSVGTQWKSYPFDFVVPSGIAEDKPENIRLTIDDGKLSGTVFADNLNLDEL